MRRPDVEGLLRSLSFVQLHDWMEYERIEPFGELRANYSAAIVACEVANTGYDLRSRGGKRYEVEDFMLRFTAEPAKERKQTVEEQVKIIHVLARALAGAPRE